MGKQHHYRSLINGKTLVSFSVVVKETNLFIQAKEDLSKKAVEKVIEYRGYIESYITRNPEFAKTLIPWHNPEPCPEIVREMIKAGNTAGVGPMAAVAGAIAHFVGLDLLPFSNEVIIENGGDIFIRTDNKVTVGIYAGKSPLSLKIGLSLDPGVRPIAVCTSSGTIGHSLSFGTADAVCVVSKSCSLADAAATSIGNRIHSNADIQKAIEFGKAIEGVEGIIVIRKDRIGMWGDIQIVPLKEKKVEFKG